MKKIRQIVILSQLLFHCCFILRTSGILAAVTEAEADSIPPRVGIFRPNPSVAEADFACRRRPVRAERARRVAAGAEAQQARGLATQEARRVLRPRPIGGVSSSISHSPALSLDFISRNFTVVTTVRCQMCSRTGDRGGSTGERVCERCLGMIRPYLERVEEFQCPLCLSDVHLSASCVDGHRVCGHCFVRGARVNRSIIGDCQVFDFCNKAYVLVSQDS